MNTCSPFFLVRDWGKKTKQNKTQKILPTIFSEYLKYWHFPCQSVQPARTLDIQSGCCFDGPTDIHHTGSVRSCIRARTPLEARAEGCKFSCVQCMRVLCVCVCVCVYYGKRKKCKNRGKMKRKRNRKKKKN